MALNIKNQRVEELLDLIVSMTGESKTEAVRRSLEERKLRLSMEKHHSNRQVMLDEFLENEIWNKIPSSVRGVHYSQEEQNDVLGYGEVGV